MIFRDEYASNTFWSHYMCVYGLFKGHFTIRKWMITSAEKGRGVKWRQSLNMPWMNWNFKAIKPQKEAAIGHDLWVSWAALCVWLKNVSETPTLYNVLVWLPSYSWFLVYRGSVKVPGCNVLWAGLDRTHHIPTVLQLRDVTLAMPKLQPNHSSL